LDINKINKGREEGWMDGRKEGGKGGRNSAKGGNHEKSE